MIVAAIANRTVEKGRQAFEEAGVDPSVIREVKSAVDLAEVCAAGCVLRVVRCFLELLVFQANH